MKRVLFIVQVVTVLMSLVDVRTEKFAVVKYRDAQDGYHTSNEVSYPSDPERYFYLRLGESRKVFEPCDISTRADAGYRIRIHVEPSTHVTYFGFRDTRSWKPDVTLAIMATMVTTKRHELRVMAVSAPYWPRRAVVERNALGSRNPFSLQNACRVAAGAALSGGGAWGNSNWADQKSLNANAVMYDYANDLHMFEQQLETMRPNLLLIGSMTLALPGAIEIARLAKKMFGDHITVVLGGKHASETIYRDGFVVRHHASSPLCLMATGKISPLFDVVVSGDGEYVVTKLGELVEEWGTASAVVSHLDELRDCAGKWIAGSVDNLRIRTMVSRGIEVDYFTVPIPAELFGFQGVFPVFGADRTAHVYSDISRGCMYNCFFCTEKESVNGSPKIAGAAERLARQMAAVVRSGEVCGDSVSAFVEDSILLMGNTQELRQLQRLLDGRKPVPFGGQVTVPLFLRKDVRQELIRLKACGLSYLYAGMETASEAVAQTMSKNIGSGGEWMGRNEEVAQLVTEAGLKYGIATLFGLGESQATRVRQLEEILRWQRKYDGNPVCVSLNWATQHPLLNVGTADYVEWGTATDSELLPYFQTLFGEASERYLVHPQKPTVAELEELRQLTTQLTLQQ